MWVSRRASSNADFDLPVPVMPIVPLMPVLPVTVVAATPVVLVGLVRSSRFMEQTNSIDAAADVARVLR